MTRRGSTAAMVLGAVLFSACSSSPSTGSSAATGSSSGPSPSPSAVARSIVALGDSVPRGTNCDCTPYPELTASDLTTPTRTVGGSNDSVAGTTTAGVLEQVNSNADVMAGLKSADAVEVEVGANDVAYSSSCGTTLSCYTTQVPRMEKNLSAIVTRVHELTTGHPVLVILLDYWSVWLGGAYAKAQGDAYVTTAEQLTHEVDTAIQSVAAQSSSAYVDLRAAFKGPDYAYDETHYLSDDGDHPNAAGHKQIASAAVAVIESTLHL